MADLPGNLVQVCDDEWGTMCHSHPNIKAIHRIVGETDSFGSEYINMCQPCYDSYLADKEAIKADESKWEMCACGRTQPELTAWRDPEEGSSGPVYYTCTGCRDKVMNAFCGDAEDDWLDDDDDDYDDDDYDEPDPHYETLDEKAVALAIEYFNKVLGVAFTLNKTDKGDCLTCTIKGNQKYKKFKRKLNMFQYNHVHGGWLNCELTPQIIEYADEIYINISTKRTNGGTAKYSKASLTLLKNMRKAAGKTFKEKTGYVTPEYRATIQLERIYY